MFTSARAKQALAHSLSRGMYERGRVETRASTLTWTTAAAAAAAAAAAKHGNAVKAVGSGCPYPSDRVLYRYRPWCRSPLSLSLPRWLLKVDGPRRMRVSGDGQHTGSDLLAQQARFTCKRLSSPLLLFQRNGIGPFSSLRIGGQGEADRGGEKARTIRVRCISRREPFCRRLLHVIAIAIAIAALWQHQSSFFLAGMGGSSCASTPSFSYIGISF